MTHLESTKTQLAHKPPALLVVLENVGHIVGLNLPTWVTNTIDFVTEEYAKIRLHQLGAYRRYDRVEILEDEQVNGPEWASTLLRLSLTHRVDQLLLVHGQDRCLVGYKGKTHIDSKTFEPLLEAYTVNPNLLDLRIVYGLNCHGVSLAPVWMALGASVVNGAAGVNWLPEPSLSIFLHRWLNGATFSQAVTDSNRRAVSIGKRIWRDDLFGNDDPHIAGSRQAIFGRHDLTITS